MKTIYISGPITDLSTGLPRMDWQQDFVNAESKLSIMGFQSINPVDIAREVEYEHRRKQEYTPFPIAGQSYTGDITLPTRADYIVACLKKMNDEALADRLHGVYVIGSHFNVLVSHGVQMEIMMAEVLGLPIYAEHRDNLRIDRTLMPIEGYGTIEELLNE